MTVRFTNHDRAIIKQRAMQCGLSEAEYIRRVSTNKVVKPRLTESETKIYRHLIGISNNLNQVVRYFNQGESTFAELLELIESISRELKKLS